MNGTADTPAPEGKGTEFIHTVIVGGGLTALDWIPRLFRDPRINLLGLVPADASDLILHLEKYGHRLTDPCPITLFHDLDELARLPRLDLIVDTTTDPRTAVRLAEAGLQDLPRSNAAALEFLLAHPPGQAVTRSEAPTNLEQRLIQEVGRAYRHGRNVGLIRLRLDTGSEGYPPEETVLARIGLAIEQSVRLEDTVGRGDDGTFTVLLPETGEATRYVASRLTSNLSNLRIPSLEGGAAVLRKTVGWACFPHHARTAQALMEQAEANMPPPTPLEIR